MARISGPLVDRIDIQIEVPAVDMRELKSTAEGESSEEMRAQVLRAREVQVKRFKASRGAHVNGLMSPRQIKTYCVLTGEAETVMEQAMDELQLSARAYHKVLKLARTIADLAGHDDIDAEDVAEAVQYRNLDRGVMG